MSDQVRTKNSPNSSGISGADASGGNTRSHPEHDREEPDGRRYYAGDGMGEQAGARIKKNQTVLQDSKQITI